MSSFLTFAASALALLCVPGPTNTLLATSGALSGFRTSWPLVLAEALGYLTAILCLQLLLAPFLQAHPAASLTMRFLCAAVLIMIAVRLWFTPPPPNGSAVSFKALYGTTLINPKALIFAFSILPAEPGGVTRPIFLASLVGFILLAGSGWIVIGALLGVRRSAPLWASGLRRAGATVLAVFASLSLASLLRT